MILQAHISLLYATATTFEFAAHTATGGDLALHALHPVTARLTKSHKITSECRGAFVSTDRKCKPNSGGQEFNA